MGRKHIAADHLIRSDSCVRLAQLQMCLKEHIAKAEDNLHMALQIREAKLGLEHVAVGDVLVMVSKVREAMGDVSMDRNEALLLRAKQIYTSAANVDSRRSLPFHTTIDKDIERISAIRNNPASAFVNGRWVDSSIAANVVGVDLGASAGPQQLSRLEAVSVPAEASSNKKSGNRRASRGLAGKERKIHMVNSNNDDLFGDRGGTAEAEANAAAAVSPPPAPAPAPVSAPAPAGMDASEGIPTFADDDGVGRLNFALQIMESEQEGGYVKAIPLMEQAVDIFMKTNGAEHPHTQTAVSNLNIMKNQELQALWMETADDFADMELNF